MTAGAGPAVTAALEALAAGRPQAALEELEALEALSGVDSPLAAALRTHLQRAPGAGSVYDAPAAFEAFISGGGNRALYAAVDDALATVHHRLRPQSLLEIGFGDGRVVAAAVTGGATDRVDLVEPSPMLATAIAAVSAAGVDDIRGRPATVQEFADGIADHAPDRGWDLLEATFALHTLEPAERTRTLSAIRPYVRSVVVVEFDVPDLSAGTADRAAFLAAAYERGIVEYDVDRDLIAQGFLVPVLVGQLQPGAVRSTWEQPAGAWVDQFIAAGYHGVQTGPVADYWWSPAFVLTAAGGA